MSSGSVLSTPRRHDSRTQLRCMWRLFIAASLVTAGCATAPDATLLDDVVTPTSPALISPPPSTQRTHPRPPIHGDLSIAGNGAPADTRFDDPTSDRWASRSDSVDDDAGTSPLAAFDVLTRRRVACFTTPAACDVASFTAPGSPEFRRISTAVTRFVRDGIRLSPRRGSLDVTIAGLARDVDTGMVVVDACERDSHVLVDARFTDLGEIIIDESVTTTRARWHLTRVATTWRIHKVDVVDRDHGGGACSAS